MQIEKGLDHFEGVIVILQVQTISAVWSDFVVAIMRWGEMKLSCLFLRNDTYEISRMHIREVSQLKTSLLVHYYYYYYKRHAT